MSNKLILALAAVAATGAAAHAQPTAGAVQAEYEVPRHTGLFVRVTPGISGNAATAEAEGTEFTLSGAGGRFGIAVGWAVQPGLIVSGELIGNAVIGPELEVEGMTFEGSDDVTWGVSYAGAGLDYYFPSNLYLSGSLGAMLMTIDTSEMEPEETEVGFGLKLGIGREWWVSDKIGLGVGLDLLAGSIEDSGVRWTVATFGLSFSATYN